MIWFEQTGITYAIHAAAISVRSDGRVSSRPTTRAGLPARDGPTVQVSPPNPNSGLGQGVSASTGAPGRVLAAVELHRPEDVGRDLNFEVGYLGSKNTRLGVPDANMNQLPAADLARGAALLAACRIRTSAQIPASSSLGAPTITAQQFLRPFPRFTTVALFRDNIGNSSYHAFRRSWRSDFSRSHVHAGVHVLEADRRRVERLLADDLHGSDRE